MKPQARIFLVLFLLCIMPAFAQEETPVPSPPSVADLQQEFTARIQKTLSEKTPVQALFYFGDIQEERMTVYQDEVPTLFENLENPEIVFTELPDSFYPHQIKDGYEYTPTLDPIGSIAFNDWLVLPYGEHDGRYYFMSTKRRIVSPDNKENITLQIMVSGLGSGPLSFKGKCTLILNDGSRKRVFFNDEGNAALVLTELGRYINSCEVKNLSGEGHIEMHLHEQGKEVFFGEADAPDLKIKYKRQ